MTLEELYNDLGTIKWIGADTGWDLAIEAVRKKIAKELQKDKQLKELEPAPGMNKVECSSCGKEIVVPDGQYFGHTCSDCSTKSIITGLLQEKCLYDGVKPGTATGIACSCPRCSPRC